jgi:hypothetical protein
MSDVPNWTPVANALLGTWPSQTAAWGKQGIAAYLSELGARGVGPDQALLAIRSYDPDADFPPSAAKLAQVARRDPGAPTGLEVVAILWSQGGVMHARAGYPAGGWRGLDAREEADDQARLDAATRHHPRVIAFIESVGLDSLKARDPRGEQYGEANRHWICREWDAFTEKANERGVAALLAGSHIDPLAALKRAQSMTSRLELVGGEPIETGVAS